ncbi:hypothetical protein [Owenweeksia hongkongensis]|uniref:hypothetical protein n=1 Tax=Owenweeksia hongkongensis TaxID=253245 RepID=UPI003A8DBD8E
MKLFQVSLLFISLALFSCDNVEPTIYSKVLTHGEIGFNISTTPDGEAVKLTIAPIGLSVDNTPFIKKISGKVTNSEIGDMNGDGFPELLVYTKAGENNTGNVEAVFTNGGKSISLIYFRPTAEDSRISTGYNGHDEFKLIDNQLRQRFPIYENGKATGRTRQAMYSFENGEDMGIFKLENVSEY